MWNGTWYKNGIIGFTVDCSTGRKTVEMLLPSIQVKPFGFYLPRFCSNHLDIYFRYFRFGIFLFLISHRNLRVSFIWFGEGIGRYGAGAVPPGCTKGIGLQAQE